jgi:hypothetical protein
MSRGRAGKVNTLKWIPSNLKLRTYLVVGNSEFNDYVMSYPLMYANIIAAPETVTNYSQKVQWILDGLPTDGQRHVDSKCLIMDDDLVFSMPTEVGYGKTSLVSVKNPELLAPMYDQIEGLLDWHALVGVHPRQMGQNAKQPYGLNGRIICMQGINREKIGRVKVDQFPILADVVLNCTLLARGQANAILTTYFQDHGPCQAPGGCSIYRTHDMQREAVQYLANRFPGFVKVVERVTKDKWLANEQGVRYDYTCAWKKLYAAGVDYARGLRDSPDREVQK